MIGDYPPEYNRAIHGPYDPSRYYGKPDTAFGDVKLKDLGSWFGRRNKSPRAFIAACSRVFWTWQMKFIQPKRAGIAPLYQFSAAAMILFYLINYKKLSNDRNYKYH